MSAPSPAPAASLPVRLWRDWLAPRWPMLLLGFALMMAFAGANALYPEIIRRSVDALEARDTAALGWIAPGIVLVTLLKGATLYAQKVVLNRTLTDVAFDMQRRLFAHLVDADVAALAREPPAALAARFTADVDTVSLAFQRVLNGALRDAMTVAGLFGALLWIDWELTLVAFAVFPLAIWPIVVIGRALRKLTRRASEGVAGMTALIAESLGGVRVAKTYAMEPWLIAKAGAAFATLRDLRRRALQRRAAIDPLMEVLAGVVVAGVIWLIGARIAAGANTLGDITGFIAALLLAAQPLRALGNLNASVQTGLAGAKRVYDLLDRRAEVIDRPGAPALAVSAGAIALDSVSFAYADGTSALDDLALAIPGGARVALVGRSGAGKSTVFNLLPRLYDVTAGAIRIDGQDLRDVSLASLRAAIALVAQEPTLFNDTVRANIALGRPGADAAAIEAAARAAAAHDFISALPQGYDTPVGERGEALSGGQRQRVAIARAFLRDAPILLLDEATSALDAESETAIRAALDRLARGRTTLVIAHRLATILDADLIAVLDAGRLVELGRHADLLAQGGLYASLYRLQFGAPAD